MQTFGTTAFHDKTGGEKMNQSKFATAGKVHIVSNENGQIVFELDPIPPYRYSSCQTEPNFWKVPYVAR